VIRLPPGLFALFCIPALAHGQTVSLSGSVEDPSYTPILSATVQLISPKGNEIQQQTDQYGQFRFAFVSAGPYSLKVIYNGFDLYESRIQMSLRSSATPSITLNLKALQQQITVEVSGRQSQARAEWGRASFDQRHRLAFLRALDPGGRFHLGAGLEVRSGAPFDETTGQDLNRYGLANDRPRVCVVTACKNLGISAWTFILPLIYFSRKRKRTEDLCCHLLPMGSMSQIA
jgi:hypothetical protein